MKLIKNKKEMEAMLCAGKQLAKVFSELSFVFCIGKTTNELDNFIFYLLDKHKMISKCFGYKKFSGHSCLSINDELVHGVPSNRVILETDLLKIDICASYNDFCADKARMFSFFENNEKYNHIKNCAEESLSAGISMFKSGKTVGCIGNAIEKVIKKYSFSVVTDFAGHGIGKNMHEDPQILNYGFPNTGQKFYVGMALAIEPMFCEFSSNVIIDKNDKWTVKTQDRGLAAHIEDTIILTENGPIVTTELD